ncbi:peptidoglycan-binding protein [Paenibacillus motobuensis]|uniref:Bacterial EndoU nuclease domain-containing protein n=1 Tax=Paenibacillus motobuensis TaxID=295324 RepID=A0ABN0Y9G5_9BACL
MEQKVNPYQVEGLADSLGPLNRMIEDQVTGMCKDVSRVVGDTRIKYSEDYVGRAADEVERLVQEIQQLALAIDDKLRIKEKTLRWAAGEYVEREKEAIRKIEEMQQKKIPLVLSREALFQEKNQTLSPFGALPVYPFVLSASVSLPVYIPPLSEELSLNPEKYSEEVLRLQQRLKELGYEVEANGCFDEETLKAVNQFKDNYGLENRRSAAGVVDDQMWRYLFGGLNGILTKDSGVYSDPVKMVQSRLKELGFDIEATGYYDEQTQRAIGGFREIYGKDLSGADGVIGEQTWNALFNIEVPKPQYTIGAYDPYNSVDVNDILNRDDPEVQKRLEQTYWATLSKEGQDRRYREIKEEMDAIDKKWADKMRRAQSGIGNQFFANLITGTSNAVVNTINTASAGLPELITEWIMGPMPEGYVDPLDDPYGKKAGVIAGNVVGFFLPFKYLKGIKTPALLTKLSPTVLRSVTAEAIFSGVTEVSDSVTDFRKDGDQSLEERLFNIAFNSSAAGVGDVAFTYAFKTISNMLKSTGAQKILEYVRPKKIEKIPEPKEVVTDPPKFEGVSKPEEAGNLTKVIKNNFKFIEGFEDHMINAQGIVRKGNKGVVGGHNLERFEKVLTDQGLNFNDVIVSKTPHPTVPGVYEIEYRLPALDRELKVVPGQYKNIPQPKTVYDPDIISNEQMIIWGQEAIKSGIVNGRVVTGYASNGLRFTGYLDESGQITNFHPSFGGE